jgi:hypothetical protein
MSAGTAWIDATPGCESGKRAYPTEGAARAAVRRANENGSRAGKGGKTPRRVYLCGLCGDYHLTAKTSRRTRG